LPPRRGPGGAHKLPGGSKELTGAIIKGMSDGDEYGDPAHPGLRVRRVGDQRVCAYRYRNAQGALRQVELGVLGTLTLTDVRSEWQRLKAIVRNGGDPRAEKKAEKKQRIAAAVQAAREEKELGLTVERVVERYLAEDVEKNRKPKGANEARRMLLQLIRFKSWVDGQRKKEALGRRRAKLPSGVVDVADLPAKDFSRELAGRLLQAYSESAPRAGAMVRSELRAAWGYGIEQGFLSEGNPFEKRATGKRDKFGGGALKPSSSRERNLSAHEVGLLLRWMQEPKTYSQTVRDALELTLRTGLRSGEVCEIHTREIKRIDGTLWLDIPGDRMKMGKDHFVPLVGKAEQIVLRRMKESKGYLFMDRSGERPILQKVLGVAVFAHRGTSKSKAYKLKRVCPVGADSDGHYWAPHDLRRTARTLLANLECPHDVGEAILSHGISGVAGTYNRAKYFEPRIQWLTTLGGYLDSLAVAEPQLDVVSGGRGCAVTKAVAV